MRQVTLWLEPAVRNVLVLSLAFGWIAAAHLLTQNVRFFRLWGLLLQFAGFWTAWEQVRKALKDSDAPSGLDRFRRWWSERPGKSSRGYNLTGASRPMAVGAGRTSVWKSDPNATTDGRIAALEENVVALRSDHDALRAEHERSVRQLKETIKAERVAREALGENVDHQLKDLRLGSIALQKTGLIWFLSGTVLSAFPEELVSLLAR